MRCWSEYERHCVLLILRDHTCSGYELECVFLMCYWVQHHFLFTLLIWCWNMHCTSDWKKGSVLCASDLGMGQTLHCWSEEGVHFVLLIGYGTSEYGIYLALLSWMQVALIRLWCMDVVNLALLSNMNPPVHWWISNRRRGLGMMTLQGLNIQKINMLDSRTTASLILAILHFDMEQI